MTKKKMVQLDDDVHEYFKEKRKKEHVIMKEEINTILREAMDDD